MYKPLNLMSMFIALTPKDPYIPESWNNINPEAWNNINPET
jgi:hypothetical protein